MIESTENDKLMGLRLKQKIRPCWKAADFKKEVLMVPG